MKFEPMTHHGGLQMKHPFICDFIYQQYGQMIEAAVLRANTACTHEPSNCELCRNLEVLEHSVHEDHWNAVRAAIEFRVSTVRRLEC